MWLFNTGDKNIALLQLSAGHLIVCLTLASLLSFQRIAKPAVLEGDRHHSVNTESLFHNCPFWATGQANAHAPIYVQQHACILELYTFNQAFEINAHNRICLTSILLELFKGKLRSCAHGNLTRVLIGDSSPSMADSLGSAGLGYPQLCKCIIPVRK